MSVGLLLQFFVRLVVARYGLQANYGVFSLALVIMNFCAMLACLGLHEGATRYIAYYRGKGEAVKIRGTVSFSLRLTAGASILIGLLLFLTAPLLAINVFHAVELELALRIFAVGLPFFAILNVLVAIFRGFDRTEPQAYFQYIVLNGFFLLLLLAVVALGMSFVAVFYAYLVALILTFVALLAFALKQRPQPLSFDDVMSSGGVKGELLSFSAPLLGTALLSVAILSMDTLMLGYFKAPEVVGLYNAAYPLAFLISIPLHAAMLIYTPVATGLCSQHAFAELRRSFTVLNKWVASLTLPIFLVLCLFPEAVLGVLFGPEYMTAAPALRILSIGFMLNNIIGPNQSTLLAYGESRFIMWTVLLTAAINVTLDILLIPKLSIIGAAIASAVSLVLTKIILCVRTYQISGTQPLSTNLAKPVVAAAVLAVLFKVTVGNLFTVTLWMLPLLFILYFAIYVLAVIFTRSFDQEDIALLLDVEKMSGVDAGLIKKVLRRFS
jgi:O-antigen/teichoic acid export membrane protein